MISAYINTNKPVINIAYPITITNTSTLPESLSFSGAETIFHNPINSLPPSSSITVYATTASVDTILHIAGLENTVNIKITLQNLLPEEYDETLLLSLKLEEDKNSKPDNENINLLLKQRNFFDNGIKKTWLFNRVSIEQMPDIQPKTGQTPITSIDSNEYSGVITWSPNDATFNPGQIYTATIALEAKHRFSFDGVPQNFFKINNSTATNAASSGIISAIFPVTDTLATYFTFDEPTNTITDYDEIGGGNSVFIPSTINDIPVLHISANAFSNKSLVYIKLPDNLLTIGDSAFNNNSLTQIKLPGSIANIENAAFSNNAITSIIIPDNLTLSNTAFDNNFYAKYTWCNNAYGEYVFDTPSFPNSWFKQNSGNEQFFKFNTVTKTITDFDPILGTNIEIPQYINNILVEHIEVNVFANKGLTSVKLPSSLLSIGNSAFSTNDLTQIILPHKLLTLGDAAFANNPLTKLYIPKSVLSIGSDAFLDANITNITIGSNVSIANNNALGIYGASFKAKYDWNTKRAGEYSYDTQDFPLLWEELGVGASQFFQYNTNTGTITDYDDTITGSNISILQYIYGVQPKHIASGAFANKSMTTVTIPDSVQTIGAAAFQNNALEEIIIGYNVIIESADSFGINGEEFKTYYDTGKLSGKYIWADSAWFRYTQDKYFTFSEGSITAYNVAGGLKLSIPSTINNIPVITIESYAFSPGNAGLALQSLHIAEGITTIQTNAFRKNPLLTSITLPESITYIGGGVFYENAVSTITIGSNVELYDNNSMGTFGAAFKTRYYFLSKKAGTYTYDATTYATPTWINTDLGTNSFFAFDSDAETITNYDTVFGTDVTIPAAIEGVPVTTLGSYSFKDKGLTSVIIPDSVTIIGLQAFYINSLTNVAFGNNVETILESAFNSNLLTNVQLPNSLTTLVRYAFSGSPIVAIDIPANVNIDWYGGSTLGSFTNSFQNKYETFTNKAAGAYVYDTTTYLVPTWINTNLDDTQFFAFDVNTGTLTGYDIAFGTDVVIPTQINGVDVLIIEENAFRNYDTTPKLTSVVIPDTVTTIKKWAFRENAITSVTFGTGLETTLESAFHTNLLTSVELPDSLLNIGPHLFFNNPDLISVKMPANANVDWTLYGGSGAFGVATSIFQARYDTYTAKAAGTYFYDTTTYITPTWINTSLGDEQFFVFESSTGTITNYDVTLGTDVIIPEQINGNDVLVIGDSAFREKTPKLTSVVIPNTVTTIFNAAFYNNTISSITFGNSVQTLKQSAFDNNQLTSIELPSSLTTLEAYVFKSNASLTSVKMPANVSVNWTMTYGDGIFGTATPKFQFRYDSCLEKAAGTYVYDTTTYIAPTWINTSLGDEQFFAFESSTGTITNYDVDLGTDVIIPEQINGNDVLVIGDSAFREKTPKLTSVVIPNTVTTIFNAAFYNNTISSVTFGNSVQTLKQSAFDSNQLTSIELPSSLTTLEAYVFKSNASLTSVKMPANVSVNWAMSYGDGIFGTATPKFQFRYDTYTAKAAGTYVYDTTTYITPTWINTSLGDEQFFAFESSTGTITNYDVDLGTDVIIPEQINGNDVLVIGDSAFREKTPKLTSVVIPNTVTTIIRWAFLGNSITNITFGNNLQTIGESAFNGNLLTSIELPDSLTDLHAYVFYGNQNLTSVKMPANVNVNWAMTSGDGIFGTATPKFQFRYDSCLEKAAGTYVYDTTTYIAPTWVNTDLDDTQFFVFNSDTGTITGYDATFAVDVTIPGTILATPVTTLGVDSFRNKGLTNIVLPEGITTIANNAFYSNSLTTVSLPLSLVTIGTGVFYQNTITEVTIGANVVGLDSNTFGVNGGTFRTLYEAERLSGKYQWSGTEWLRYTLDAAFTVVGGVITAYDEAIGGAKLNIAPTINETPITAIGTIDDVTGVFQNKGLTNVELPDSLSIIGKNAFRSNALLTDLIIPDSVTSIAAAAFQDCIALASVALPNNVLYTTISGNLFQSTSLNEITIPDNVTTINQWAFNGNDITTIDLVNVATVGASAFYANPIIDITIGEGVSIGDNNTFGTNGASFKATYEPAKLEGQYFFDGTNWIPPLQPTDPQYFTTSAIDASSVAIDDYNIAGGADVVIPDPIDAKTVTTINAYAFMGKTLTSIILSDSIHTISNQALRSNSLASLIIPDSVTTLGTQVAANNQLTDLIIGIGLSIIPNQAFQANLLTNIIIPPNITAVNFNAFENNPIISITIGANVIIDSNSTTMGTYGSSFATLYNTNKLAGTYTYSSGNWQKIA